MSNELKTKMADLICKIDAYNGEHCIAVVPHPDCDLKSFKRKLRFINKKLFK